MVSRRTGKSSLGCLVSLLVLSAVIYFGVNIAEVYWRYYQFVDEMKQQVRFASHLPNDLIVRRLQTAADSLGLPSEAGQVRVQRANKTITVESDYEETVELPLTTRDIHFRPRAQGSY